MMLFLYFGALLAHPIPSGNTVLSAAASELPLEVPQSIPAAAAVSFLQEAEEGEDDAVLADGEAEHSGNGKKKLKKKIAAMEKKAHARQKMQHNQHAKKQIKRKIKASEKIAEAKERKDAAAEKKEAEQEGDGGEGEAEDDASVMAR